MLEVRLLGQFDVRLDGKSIELPSRPAQSLLAYLLLHPSTGHRREKLAGVLWPDASEANARSNLRHALWRLRKALKPGRQAGSDYLLADDSSIAFDADAAYWLDVAVLERRIGERGAADESIAAASVYQGELLPGFYDEWVVLERERLQTVFERRMQGLLERLVEGQRWPEVLEWGERWIGLGHAPEPAYRALMVAHSGLSDVARVAAVYQRCLEALRKELGVEPSEETRALYERLSRGEKAPAAPATATFQSRYRLEAEIGRGGMGVIYLAHDTLLDRTVAVKLLTEAQLSTEGRARLLREAQAAAHLHQPNIVVVHDAGEADGVPFIVMEWVEGESLHRRPPGSLEEIVSVALQICAALDHAHSHGIVHRDLKPENILLTPDGQAKLMDFGLARSTTAASRLTAKGTVVGTVFYLAPEQALGHEIDGRADLYSLGVVLYELVTGRLPFTGDDPLAVISQHIYTPPVPPRMVRADLPSALDALIVRLLAKDPTDRFASARDVAFALKEVARAQKPKSAEPTRPAQPVPEMPTGTVTFLFTDIEGSTQLWEQYPEAMKTAHARQEAILREAIGAHSGYAYKMIGDAFQVAFATAPEALAAALAAQRALHAEAWGVTGPLRVRMALHTGVTEERRDDYVGPVLNRPARLLTAGHGGQMLLTQATYDLVRDELPAGVSLRDLGEHRLKDLVHPEHLYELVAPDLPSDFPPLKTLDTFRHNLPVQLTSFIGRETEIGEIKRLLTALPGFATPPPSPDAPRRERGLGAEVGVRLLTLTGAGGCGKTRLALQVAAELVADYPDGVWLVELASLAEPGLVPQAVASVLDVREQPGRPLTETLSDYLRARRLLLVLDNCEHLIEGCAALAETLLRACPNLRILATSREALGMAGETAWLVPSLSLPDPRQVSPGGAQGVAAIREAEAGRLFVDRAVAAQRTFSVTEHNALAVAQVCERLDGIPLAIELAAARVKVLGVEQIVARLDDRFSLLTGGSRTALPRHQTLRACMDWSYGLLSPAEQALLRRLAVFVGGWTLEASEVVCAGNGVKGSEVLDLLTQLANKSLVVVEHKPGREARYRLRETIRQYAHERLLASGEPERVRARHLDFFLRLVEKAGPELERTEEAAWLERLEQEYDNLRAALGLALERGEALACLQMGTELRLFWFIRGYLAEGRARLEEILALPGAADRAEARAEALNSAGFLARYQGDYSAAQTFIHESLAIQRELGDRKGMADALSNLGYVTLHQGDHEVARSQYEESLAINRELGNEQGIADSLHHLALVAFCQKDYATAHSLNAESLAIWRRLGDRQGVAAMLYRLGNVVLHLGHYAEARSLFENSLAISMDLGYKWGIAQAFEGIAALAVGQGQSERAARLAGAAAAVRADAGLPLSPLERALLEQWLEPARQALSDEVFAAGWADGRAMTLEQALAYASDTAQRIR